MRRYLFYVIIKSGVLLTEFGKMAVKRVDKKKKNWTRPHHKVTWALVRAGAFVVARMRYDYRYEKVSAKEYPQALVLCNHQNDFDPFMLGVPFSKPVYYIANETLFSTGFFGKFLSWALAPIPIKKNTSDTRAVANLFRVAKEGGNIAVFPEGNTCIAGKSVYIKKTIAAIARKLKIPLVLYRLEGGYGVKPRWSDVKRKGYVEGKVVRILKPEEMEKMSVDELYDIITEALFVDEHLCGREFSSPKMAEGAERIFYVCPVCGLTKFKTAGNHISCEKCSCGADFEPSLTLKSDSPEFGFADENEWYEFQQDYLRKLDKNAYLDHPAYEDEVSVFSVVPYKKKKMIAKNISLALFSDRIRFGGKNGSEEKKSVPEILFFKDMEAASVFKANTLVLSMKNKEIYQLRGNKEFNALKYVNFLAHFQGKGMFELTELPRYEGECDVEFLGI